MLKLRCFARTCIACSYYSKGTFPTFLRTSLFGYLFYRKLFFWWTGSVGLSIFETSSEAFHRLFRCSEKLRKIHRKTPVLGPILWVLPSFWEYLFIEQLHVAASVTSTFLAYDFYFFVQFSPNFVTFSNILPKSINLLSLES